MRSKELAYTEDTTTFLVAGKDYFGYITRDQFDQISDSIDELARATGQPLVALPSGFVYQAGPTTQLSCVVGVLVGRVDNGYENMAVPSAIAQADMLDAIEQTGSLPWDEIAALFPEPKWRSEQTGLHVLACGPLAGGWVAYGVLAELCGPVTDPDDDEFDWDWNDLDDEGRDAAERYLADTTGPAAAVPGLELVHGSLMSQEPQPQAVYGVGVQGTYFEGASNVVDMSQEAHRSRVESLGVLADQSTYYLISYYD